MYCKGCLCIVNGHYSNTHYIYHDLTLATGMYLYNDSGRGVTVDIVATKFVLSCVVQLNREGLLMIFISSFGYKSVQPLRNTLLHPLRWTAEGGSAVAWDLSRRYWHSDFIILVFTLSR